MTATSVDRNRVFVRPTRKAQPNVSLGEYGRMLSEIGKRAERARNSNPPVMPRRARFVIALCPA
jgi:hypothetical protein